MEHGDSPDFSEPSVLDMAGKEAGNLFRNFTTVVALGVLRIRTRGQKEAEARVKVTEQSLQEARELQDRQARDAKSKDPRNVELAGMTQIPRLGNGVPLYRTPAQLAQRALEWGHTPAEELVPAVELVPIPRPQSPTQEALKVINRGARPHPPEVDPQELARLRAQQRIHEPPTRY